MNRGLEQCLGSGARRVDRIIGSPEIIYKSKVNFADLLDGQIPDVMRAADRRPNLKLVGRGRTGPVGCWGG
jgi:hypothetical protein